MGKLIVGKNDLVTMNPMLATEWHPVKNGKLKPSDFAYQSNKKVWWVCSKGHEWKAAINNRNAGRGCPYCSNKKVLEGYNDLASEHPEIAAEWNYAKNAPLTPNEVVSQSNKKVWWLCEKGHEWEAPIIHRVRVGTGCPYCYGRYAIKGVNDLFTTDPLLAAEWNYKRNGSLSPSDVMSHTGKKVWWICEKGHEWQDHVNNRSNGRGCPYCSNHQAIVGENDLQTLYPELMKEWHPTKNKGINAIKILPGSNKKVWWICEKGHEWKTQVANRTLVKTGCPICREEQQTSFPEQAIFYYIKRHFSDAINRDKMYGFELDVFIPSIMTAIEYDGFVWHQDVDKDLKKDISCYNKKITLIRVREAGCPIIDRGKSIVITREGKSTTSLNNVIEEIFKILKIKDERIDVDKDSVAIADLYEHVEKEESLEVQRPELAKNWNYARNGMLTPHMVAPKSNRKYWWICENGHEWQASPNSMKTGVCPYCNNKKVLAGFNDLKTTNPSLVAEWDYNKNTISPEEVTYGSGRKVWWICEKGHEWEAVINKRVSGQGCPYCSNHRIISGENDLHSLYPELMEKWHLEKNKGIDPRKISPGSYKKVWWVCEKGHEWQAALATMCKGASCPYCINKRVLKGFNDLKTTNPELLNTWNFKRNKISPEEVTCGSGKKVWWICEKGHEWEARIYNRTRGSGCSYCKQL